MDRKIIYLIILLAASMSLMFMMMSSRAEVCMNTTGLNLTNDSITMFDRICAWTDNKLASLNVTILANNISNFNRTDSISSALLNFTSALISNNTAMLNSSLRNYVNDTAYEVNASYKLAQERYHIDVVLNSSYDALLSKLEAFNNNYSVSIEDRFDHAMDRLKEDMMTRNDFNTTLANETAKISTYVAWQIDENTQPFRLYGPMFWFAVVMGFGLIAAYKSNLFPKIAYKKQPFQKVSVEELVLDGKLKTSVDDVRNLRLFAAKSTTDSSVLVEVFRLIDTATFKTKEDVKGYIDSCNLSENAKTKVKKNARRL